MRFFMELCNNSGIWIGYFAGITILSIVPGIANFPRFLYERRNQQANPERTKWDIYGYALRFSIFDAIQIFLGYFLIFLNVQIISFFFSTSSKCAMAVSGILILIFLFYSLFSISGQSVEVLNKILIDPGIKTIKITWKGIIIDLNQKTPSKDTETEKGTTNSS